MQVYIESILALQERSNASSQLPLAIMTSDDTHARTQKLLAQHGNFGMRDDQVTLLKQEKVSARSVWEAQSGGQAVPCMLHATHLQQILRIFIFKGVEL